MAKYDDLTRSELILLHVLRDAGPDTPASTLKEMAGIRADCKFYTALSGLRKKGMVPTVETPVSRPVSREGIVSPVGAILDNPAPRQVVSGVCSAWNEAFPHVKLQPAGAMQLFEAAGKDMDLLRRVILQASRKSLQSPFPYVKVAARGEAQKNAEAEQPKKGAVIQDDEIYVPSADEIATLRKEVQRARELIPTPTFDI